MQLHFASRRGACNKKGEMQPAPTPVCKSTGRPRQVDGLRRWGASSGLSPRVAPAHDLGGRQGVNSLTNPLWGGWRSQIRRTNRAQADCLRRTTEQPAVKHLKRGLVRERSSLTAPWVNVVYKGVQPAGNGRGGRRSRTPPIAGAFPPQSAWDLTMGPRGPRRWEPCKGCNPACF